MTVNYLILHPSNFITSAWSGGKTTQMIIYPTSSSYKNLDFKFRISSATVETDQSVFTILPDIHRFITPLNGLLSLKHDEMNEILLNPFDIYEFPGDIETISHGKVQDFNLMLAKGVKGSLKKIQIDHSLSLTITHKNDSHETFEIFYTFDTPINFKLANETFILESNSLLVIEQQSSKKSILVEMNSDISTTILRAVIELSVKPQ